MDLDDYLLEQFGGLASNSLTRDDDNELGFSKSSYVTQELLESVFLQNINIFSILSINIQIFRRQI